MLIQTEIDSLLKKIESGEYTIEQALESIAQAQYGEDVREAIYAGLCVCYFDGKAGATDLQARSQIAELQAREIFGVEIQTGQVNIAFSAAGTQSVDITFDTPFTSPPAVLLSFNYMGTSYSTTKRTTDGFTLTAKVTEAATVEFWWVAINKEAVS